MGLLNAVEFYVTTLIKNELPGGFKFHNLQHTRDVVAAVGDIAISEDVDYPEWEDLMIAAWFHDVGFTFSAKNHEYHSIRLARAFLKNQTVSDKYRIERISKIIAATRIDHQPQHLAEYIIKDADTYHLSKPDYPQYLEKLRYEWFEIQGMDINEHDWLHLNLDFLKKHRYHTQYGKRKLEGRKWANIRMLEFKQIDTFLMVG